MYNSAFWNFPNCNAVALVPQFRVLQNIEWQLIDSKHLRKSTQGSRTIAYPLGGYGRICNSNIHYQNNSLEPWRTVHCKWKNQREETSTLSPAINKLCLWPPQQQTKCLVFNWYPFHHLQLFAPCSPSTLQPQCTPFIAAVHLMQRILNILLPKHTPNPFWNSGSQPVICKRLKRN